MYTEGEVKFDKQLFEINYIELKEKRYISTAIVQS